MRNFTYLLLLIVCLAGCKKTRQEQPSAPVVKENKKAKQMLQGIWLNEDAGDVAFRAVGDSILYPDSMSMPVHFMVIGDTLVLKGEKTVKYPIVKQGEHLFIFKNQNNEAVRLVKSEDPDDIFSFEEKRVLTVNQRKLIKRDTVVVFNNERYHCYVQVNPTTYKVYASSYNDEGVEVQNIYYDNIIHISVFNGARKVFSKDFYKKDFAKQVPQDFLRQSVLSDFEFGRLDEQGVHYNAMLCIPDSPSSYVVEVIISYAGQLSLRVDNGNA
ncbi:MAG: DUF4738 domain-containing protein [Prevotella sp.]|nr:DUF4738 domain-containing protein [Prevotella sp.]